MEKILGHVIGSGVDTSDIMTISVVNALSIGYDDVSTDSEGAMATDTEWQAKVKGLLKAELKRRNIGYRELAERLGAMGVHDSERNIANKISRGGFTAVFLVQCLEAIGGAISAAVGLVAAGLISIGSWQLLEPREPDIPAYKGLQAQNTHYRPGGSRCNPARL